MQVGQPQQTVFVEPLEIPVKEPDRELEPAPIQLPEPKPELMPVAL
jgi:hypothetical protein